MLRVWRQHRAEGRSMANREEGGRKRTRPWNKIIELDGRPM
jgi:hypothetical protein